MPDEVTLEVTQVTDNVTVETTDGDVVEIKVVATQGSAATVSVGTTTTGAAGTNASVTNSGSTSAAVFNFTIPRGATGEAGPNSVTSATTSDGTANLSLASATISGLLTAGHIHGNLAGTLYTHVRTGEAMSKGDPFYISGYHVGSSQPIVMRADASDAAKMPAVGVMDADYTANTSSANGIISGTLGSIDTDGYDVNSAIYVANGGGYSNTVGTVPQQIGITERANQNTGAFIVTSQKVIASSDISDASTIPVYNDTTELYEQVAVLYNDEGAITASDFISQCSFTI